MYTYIYIYLPLSCNYRYAGCKSQVKLLALPHICTRTVAIDIPVIVFVVVALS